jgi:hypothetical protein
MALDAVIFDAEGSLNGAIHGHAEAWRARQQTVPTQPPHGGSPALLPQVERLHPSPTSADYQNGGPATKSREGDLEAP